MDIILSILWYIFSVLLKIFLGVGMLTMVIYFILMIRDSLKGDGGNIRIFW